MMVTTWNETSSLRLPSALKPVNSARTSMKTKTTLAGLMKAVSCQPCSSRDRSTVLSQATGSSGSSWRRRRPPPCNDSPLRPPRPQRRNRNSPKHLYRQTDRQMPTDILADTQTDINRQRCHYRETVTPIVIENERLWDDAITFARWQHPGIGRGARFAVSNISRLVTVFGSV